MEKENKKKMILVLAFALTSLFTYANCCADSCIVINCNSSKIKIGNRNIEIGLEFDDNRDSITWTNDQECFSVKYFESNKSREFVAAQFPQKKVLLRPHASTKGCMFDDDEYYDTIPVHYIMDTLSVPRRNNRENNNTVIAVVYFGDNPVFSQITISKDGEEYLLPRKIFGKSVSEIVCVEIFENGCAVWRKLYVKPLPLMLD